MNEETKSWTKTVAVIVAKVALEIGLCALYIAFAQILWNATITEIFGLAKLTYLQSTQLLILYDVCISFSRRLNRIRED